MKKKPKKVLDALARKFFESVRELIAIVNEHGSRSDQARDYILSHFEDDPDWKDLVLLILLAKEAAPTKPSKIKVSKRKTPRRRNQT